MLELTIHENFPLIDHNKYIDVVISVAKQCGDLVPVLPVTIHFDFYCRNVCDYPHVVSADGHKWIVGALVACGVIPSGYWNNINGYVDVFHVDAKDPRVVVRIV